MNLPFWTFLLSLAISSSVLAQTGTISGKITDSITGKPSDGVALSLLLAADSSLVKTAVSESDGLYVFERLAPGSYLLAITADGYLTVKNQLITLTEEQPVILVSTVKLQLKPAENLEEVTVSVRVPLIEHKIDRTVVNVDQMLSADGNNALELLEKSPGVMVDQNGGILLKGKPGVLIYIDDKPTYLSGPPLQNYLKAIPASAISQIEIMTHPPAKYDASGNVGIINIITKKSKLKGFNGSFRVVYGQGRYFKSYNSLSMNYRNNKINIYGTFSPSANTGFSDLYIYRTYKNEDFSTQSTFNQNTKTKSHSQSGSVRLGMDYYLDQKTTLGISMNGLISNSSEKNRNISLVGDAAGNPVKTVIADNGEKELFKNGGVNFNFRHTFDSTGRQLTMDLDYINYGTSSKQQYINNTYTPDGTLTATDRLDGNLPAGINIVAFKTDYSHPMKKDAELDAGFKTSYTSIDNLVNYYSTISGVVAPDYDKSNHFKYREMINAAYLNYRKSMGRFGFQAGLRAEGTLSRGVQLGNPVKPTSGFNRDYLNLFPTAYVSYKLDSAGNNQLVTSYGRRIDRPFYQDLNPFIRPLDKFTYYSGNPQLRPQFSHTFSLTYNYKSYFSADVSYMLIKNLINETIEINSDKLYFSRPGNIGRSESVSFSLNATIPVKNWLTSNIYTEVAKTGYQSKLYTETLHSSGTYFYIYASNIFKFRKVWSAEISGNYTTNVTAAQFILIHRGTLDFAIKRNILKDKGSLKITIRDALYTQLNNGIINNLRLTDASYTNRYDSRVLYFTFSYSFGKPFVSEPKHEGGSAESEQQRVKN